VSAKALLRDFEDHDVARVQAGRRSQPAHPSASPSTIPPLSAISDEAAALHYEQFKHGPKAVRSYATDDLVVCVLSGILTPRERTLIGVGEADRVRWRRALHQVAFEESYARRMQAIMGRPVSFYLGTVSIETDVAVYILKIGAEHADQMSDVAAHDWRTRAAC
jgi:uncharacterized protein YbcI